MVNKNVMEDEQFVHREHNQWLSKLVFYREEIEFFQKALDKVMHSHNHEYSFLESVGEYRRILLKKVDHINELVALIKHHEKALACAPKMDQLELDGHQQVKNRYVDFVNEFELMKKTLKRYAAYND